MNGVTDYRTDIFVIVNPEGKVFDQMIGDVGLFCFLIRECRISKDGKIFTYQLKTTESASVDFEVFKQFHGYREDHVYKITPDGKFKEVGSRKYQPRVYTMEGISDKNYRIWNGEEVRVAE